MGRMRPMICACGVTFYTGSSRTECEECEYRRTGHTVNADRDTRDSSLDDDKQRGFEDD